MTTAPIGNEHEIPIAIKATTATERAAFRRCRRQWFLSTVKRLTSAERNPNFWFGELIHSGLEAYYRGQAAGFTVEAREEACLNAYESAYYASVDSMRADLGFLWPSVEPVYRKTAEMGMEMLAGYVERERLNPLVDEVVQVEKRLFVPIRTAAGRKVGTLSVRADLVGRREGRLVVVDHKTAAARMASAQLDMDDQLTAEVYAVWQSLGELPEEAIYNALVKKVPHPPKLLKSGKLSVDKSQLTTYDLFIAEIRKQGLAISDYSEILFHLKTLEQEGNAFFVREGVFRTPGQMATFAANLFEEFRDMVAVGKHPERAYPNPSPFNCPGCPVKLICMSMMDQTDVATVIQLGFIIGDPRV